MKFGYYPPTPWSDFHEIRIDTTKVYPSGIDALDDHEICMEVMDDRTHLHRLYFTKAFNADTMDNFTVHCPFCDNAMERVGIVSKKYRTAMYRCENCVKKELED